MSYTQIRGFEALVCRLLDYFSSTTTYGRLQSYTVLERSLPKHLLLIRLVQERGILNFQQQGNRLQHRRCFKHTEDASTQQLYFSERGRMFSTKSGGKLYHRYSEYVTCTRHQVPTIKLAGLYPTGNASKGTCRTNRA